MKENPEAVKRAAETWERMAEAARRWWRDPTRDLPRPRPEGEACRPPGTGATR